MSIFDCMRRNSTRPPSRRVRKKASRSEGSIGVFVPSEKDATVLRESLAFGALFASTFIDSLVE